ncbi:mannitol dehydrogenase family protein [Alteromonas halophila]|uniref:Mannitol 2-dehydrogenase n=1 Tax=Alteromonas halophila TaxID=516698 RepID=A0A918MZN6_9ALTE|nr:mannitol dehydrogenase family protein [Alteromonas halophila]GGW93264.1 mannitol 2-dehydrogenase [Alteromonas halophila]
MQHTQMLSNQRLSDLPASVIKPGYARQSLKTGIVHVGVGGFHRAHQAVYTDAYMSATGDTRWGVCGVGLRENDRKMQQLLAEQDFLYTVLERKADGSASAQVIGCMTDFLLGCDDPGAVIRKMADPDTHIVSLTITEGGYNFNPSTGEFDFNNPDVQHDLANPDAPRLVFGYLARALKQRRDSGLPPFTVQSCDNIQHNGDVTRNMLLAYIRAADPDLATWVASEVAFPNAMVDRITPATTSTDIHAVQTMTGLTDQWPVTCESFHQWVIEDTFSSDRPQWEKCGVQFVADVTPYETMKIRLLNASHTVLGVLGSLAGYRTIDEAVSDPVFTDTLRVFMDSEVTPVLAPVKGIDLGVYKQTLLQRFANPNIKDSLTRICSESSSKVATFLVPTIRENVKQDGAFEISALVVAAWCYYSATHTSQSGEALEVIDALKDQLQQAGRQSGQQPLAFLHQADIFADLAQQPDFTRLFETFVSALFAGEPVSRLMQQASVPAGTETVSEKKESTA